MPLPLSRDFLFAPGRTIPSSVLNNIQEQLVNGNAGYHARDFDLFHREGLIGDWTFDVANTWFDTSTDGHVTTAHIDGFSAVKASLRNLTARVQDAGATSTVSWRLSFIPAAFSGGAGSVVDSVESDGSGTEQDLVLEGPYTQTEAGIYVLGMVATGGGSGERRVRPIITLEIALT